MATHQLSDCALAYTPLTGRRQFLAGLGAGAALLALGGCASTGGFSLVEAIRRLLTLSSQNAFARLTREGGFYENALTRLDLPDVLGTRGGVLQQILVSALFKQRLQRAFNHFAEDAAYHAAPAVADAVRMVGVDNALALVRGHPAGATAFLRDSMGGRLVDVMVPALGDAMRVSKEPLVGQVLSALVGVDVGGVAQAFAGQVDNVIWNEIGREEAAIRANPRATGDPLLIGVFGAL